MPRHKAFKWTPWAAFMHELWLEDQPSAVAVDTETTGVAFHDVPFAATLTWRSPEGGLRSAYIDLEDEHWRDRAEILTDILSGTPTWVFWNAKFDLAKLDYIGALPALDGHVIEDGQPLAALLDENRRMGLKVRAVEDLGIEDVVEVEVKSGPNKGTFKTVAREEHHLKKVRQKLKLRKEDGYHLLPREVVVPYAIRDTELTLLWWEKHRPMLPPDLEPVYAEEIKLIHVLRAMEANGVNVDVDYLASVTDEYGAKVMEGWQRLVELTGMADFNPNSPKQLLAAFDAAGAKLVSTDKAAIRTLLSEDWATPEARELAEALVQYRSDEKVYATYLRPLSEEQRDGVWHPWFNNVGPRTGRMSSSAAKA